MTPLPREARRELLWTAREAILAAVEGRAAPSLSKDARLLEARGAFVTLSRRGSGELRGCIGYLEALFPVVETVARAAVAAALQDDRFPPVTAAELPSLSIDLSLLGRASPIRAEDVEVGRHGLVVSRGPRRGLLLPQVAVEQGWARETFLEHTCLKARLPENAWRLADTELLAFEAEVFSEDDD